MKEVFSKNELAFVRRFHLTMNAAFGPKTDLHAMYKVLSLAQKELTHFTDLRELKLRLRNIRQKMVLLQKRKLKQLKKWRQKDETLNEIH